ncbi:hypothetical protein L1887_19606 [Cichorium endivia]|nr:hypothetical protein L1887_19606 [Cichorium endivia]
MEIIKQPLFEGIEDHLVEFSEAMRSTIPSSLIRFVNPDMHLNQKPIHVVADLFKLIQFCICKLRPTSKPYVQ